MLINLANALEYRSEGLAPRGTRRGERGYASQVFHESEQRGRGRQALRADARRDGRGRHWRPSHGEPSRGISFYVGK